jgi:hypothetical protein
MKNKNELVSVQIINYVNAIRRERKLLETKKKMTKLNEIITKKQISLDYKKEIENKTC